MKSIRGNIFLVILAGFLSGCTASSEWLQSMPDGPFILHSGEETEPDVPASIPARNGFAQFPFGSRSLSIVIDQTGSAETDGVVITAIPIGGDILIETADPLHRFLPSAQITPGTTRQGESDSLQVTAPQVPREYRWSLMPVGQVSTIALKRLRIGTSTAADLPVFLQNHTSSRGLNLLLPGNGLGSMEQPVQIYQTPASMTLLILPDSGTTGEPDLIPLTALSLLVEDLPQLSETLLSLEPPVWLGTGSIPGTGGNSSPVEEIVNAPVEEWPQHGQGQPSQGDGSVQTAPDQADPEPAAAPSPADPSAGSPSISAGESGTFTCQQGVLLVTRQATSSITIECSLYPDAAAEIHTTPEVDPAILGTCPPEVHDRFTAIGPDGHSYRTWHPVTVPVDSSLPDGLACTFAHEHGDPPHPDAAPPLFGYAAFHAGLTGQITDHASYKVFTHRAGGLTGWALQEPEQVRPDWDMMVWMHMGTSSPARISSRYHEVGFWSRDLEDRITEIHLLADTGDAVDGCGQHTTGPSRRIASVCDFTHETWQYHLALDHWNASFQVEVSNPMTYLTASLQSRSARLVPSSENICGTAAEPCRERLPYGSPGSCWLGNLRMLRWPDWRWLNHAGEEFTCTDPFGIPLEDDLCSQEEYGALRQRVAVLNWVGEPGTPWDRTLHNPGTALPLGAPGR